VYVENEIWKDIPDMKANIRQVHKAGSKALTWLFKARTTIQTNRSAAVFLAVFCALDDSVKRDTCRLCLGVELQGSLCTN
jgi:hypothetical protein